MEFFIIKNDEQQGPFTVEQLSGMNIMPETPVWAEGMPDWTTADKVAELQPLVAYAPRLDGQDEPPAMPQGPANQPPQWNNAPSQQAPYTAPQQPYGYAASQQPQYAAPEAPRPKKSHTALWVTLAIVAVLACVLALTNPDQKDHCRAIANVTKDWSKDKIENITGGGFLGGITNMVTGPIVGEIIDGIVEVDNYGLFSLGHIDIGDSSTKVSFGIMGHVFTFNKNQLDEKIEEAIGVKTNEAIDAIKGGINDIFTDNDDTSDDQMNEEPVGSEGDAVPNTDDEEVTAEDRVDGDFDMPAEVDTVLKTITKEGAKAAHKAIDKAIDEMFN